MNDTTTPTALPSAHEAATAAYADSSSAPPETASTPETTTAAATVQPGATETPADSASTETPTTETPEPPKWRWQDILENQRQKTAQETEARLKQELGWAMDIPAESRPHISTALQLMQALNTNPAQTIALLQKQLGLQNDQPTGRPEPDVDAGNGTLLYSAAQMEKLRQWDRQQILNDVNQRFAPYEQERQSRAVEQQRQELVHTVTKQLERMRSRPHFKEHESDIRSLMLADEQLSLQDAYEQVLLEKVIPSMSKQSESQVLAQMKTRAVQATVNPSGATPTAPASLIGNARAAAEAAYRDA